MKRVVTLLRVVNGEKVEHKEARKHAFTNAQVDVIGWEVDEALSEPEEDPPGLTFKVWTTLVMRLVQTIRHQRAEVVRAHEILKALDATIKRIEED